jgi:hypothetical protein
VFRLRSRAERLEDRFLKTDVSFREHRHHIHHQCRTLALRRHQPQVSPMPLGRLPRCRRVLFGRLRSNRKQRARMEPRPDPPESLNWHNGLWYKTLSHENGRFH